MMNEREAFRRYRREEAVMRKWKDFVKRTMRELDFIEDSMHADIARELATTRAGLKCLHAYWGHTEYGWMRACGTDGRWKRVARTVGWPRFSRIIGLAREMETCGGHADGQLRAGGDFVRHATRGTPTTVGAPRSP